MPIFPKKIVQALSAYHPPLEGRRQAIRLDFNENTELFDSNISAYPEYAQLCHLLAQHKGVAVNQLLLTNGSDEGLQVIAQTFIEPGVDVALTSSPTFILIPHGLLLAGASLIEVPLQSDFCYDLDALQQAIQAHQPKLVVLASPDNPSGAVVDLAWLEAQLQAFPNTLFTLDEAYSDFTGISALSLIQRYDNLLVTQTFSKAYGMAGLRLGVVYGQASVIAHLQKVRSPYSVNSSAVSTAEALLAKPKALSQTITGIMQRKAQLVEAIENAGWRVHHGQANFFMMFAGMLAQPLCDFCQARGVLIRNRSKRDSILWGWVRVSTGTAEENQAFLDCLAAYRAQHAIIFDLDDTLIDTTHSFDAVVKQLFEHYTQQTFQPQALQALREQGGFNDDWQAAHALISHTGATPPPLAALAEHGQALYLQIAAQVETPHIQWSMLSQLAKRYRLFIYTGRVRAEYDCIWKETLAPYFEAVYCKDDLQNCQPKPCGSGLSEILTRHHIDAALYVGNSVDDMKAAKASGLLALGVSHTQCSERLYTAGADLVLSHLNQLLKAI